MKALRLRKNPVFLITFVIFIPMLMRKVKPGEKLVMEYFEFNGYSNIQYEPEPNCPPDFLLDDKIAVEARRLNQFKHFNGANKPLEELEYQIMPRIRNLIKSFDNIPSHQTSWVNVSFKRPLKVDKNLIVSIEQVLQYHLNHLDKTIFYDITPTLQIRCRPSAGSVKHNKPFIWASCYDKDVKIGGVNAILESLRIVIQEKEKKILAFKDKYPTWWLAVNVHIGLGLEDIEMDDLKRAFDIETFFEKIIFIAPSHFGDSKELVLKFKR